MNTLTNKIIGQRWGGKDMEVYFEERAAAFKTQLLTQNK
jgi:hypothetical protein